MIRCGKQPDHPQWVWFPQVRVHWPHIHYVGIIWLRWTVYWLAGMRETGEGAGWNWWR